MSDHIPVVMQLKVNQEFVTGINEASSTNKAFLLNGNMIKDFLKISSKDAGSVNTNDVMLYDNLGQKMNIEITRYLYNITVDMRTLKPGMYYLRYNGKQIKTFKALKL